MDQAAFKSEFEKFEKAGNVAKVWVCGPPEMQEAFDRALDGVRDKSIEYHVL